MTAQAWIDETRDMLLSGYVEELLLLASNIGTTSETTIEVTGAGDSGIVPGVIIEISMEAMYVSAVAGSTVSVIRGYGCLLYTSPSPRDGLLSRMPSSA